MTMAWNQIGNVAPAALSDARLQLHYGALVLGSTAHSVLAHAADDSHTNLGVVAGALRTQPLDPSGELSLELQMKTFSIAFENGLETSTRIDLEGKTLDEALRWVESQLQERIDPDATVGLRNYPDFPETLLTRGGRFRVPDQDSLGELATWFGNAQSLFESFRVMHPAMSTPRVWPHHFDLGALIPVEGEGRSIGLGLSPGDHHYDQPYFYCSPYPAPSPTGLPDLAIGRWHTKGFVSAVLTGDELVTCSSQGDWARSYLSASIAACQSLLAGVS
jgi:hypothetical protein